MLQTFQQILMIKKLTEAHKFEWKILCGQGNQFSNCLLKHLLLILILIVSRTNAHFFNIDVCIPGYLKQSKFDSIELFCNRVVNWESAQSTIIK